jgi:hypothetical protein
MSTFGLICLIKAYALQYGVDPNLAVAVFNVESGNSHHEFRIGLIGWEKQVVGPAGINVCFANKWNIYDLRTNIERGVLALKPRGREKSIKDVLRRYNKKFNYAYWKAVQEAYAKYSSLTPSPGAG